MEGSIALGLDRIETAEQEGRTRELKRLAEELVPVFEARDIHREALAALLLFQRACEEERMTVEIARQVAERVKRRSEGVGG